MRPIDIIKEFDAYLVLQKRNFTGVAIGGAPLALLGVIDRETRDCDILDPKIPSEILDLARAFAKQKRKTGELLADDWLNNGPSSLKENLPLDWRSDLRPVYQGKALTLFTLSRLHLIQTKLFALCDRGIDHSDCLALKPTKEELKNSIEWVKQQDANPNWPKHVEDIIRNLGRELGYEL